MPKPCWAVIRFGFEPLPNGSGVVYTGIIRDDKLHYKYQEHIKAALPDALKQGLYGWEVTDVKITLLDGEHHSLHTHPLDFFVCTPMAVMNGLMNCGTVLLEPMLKVRISVPEICGGVIIRDFIDMRGEFEPPIVNNNTFIIEGVLPVATSLDYPVKLLAQTNGRGTITSRFSHYRECPLELGATTPYRGINPLDRAKFILKVRGAIH
jgi:ribosomal protection tetracycline resistance protein